MVNCGDVLLTFKSLRLVNLEENQKLLGQTNPVLLKGTKRLSQFLVQNKILKQEVDPKPLLDDRLIREVNR